MAAPTAPHDSVKSDAVLALAQSLIRCPSVTPEDAGAQKCLKARLETLGMTCRMLPFGPVSNLFAYIAGPDNAGPHLCFAGHTDVVPPGAREDWRYPPFEGAIADGMLYGRGAADMKGAVASFAVALAEYVSEYGPPPGTVSMLITGDEEGAAVDGTEKVLGWMRENSLTPDFCLVGEPTNPGRLGEEIKIGRRGSLTGTLTVRGRQGHVAYPHLADNPVPRLCALARRLSEHSWDAGTAFFQPTHLEVTNIDAGNTADNVIPGSACATFNVRFNDLWTGRALEQAIRDVLDSEHMTYQLETRSGSESFRSAQAPATALLEAAVRTVTGLTPQRTTTGGTSDARFIQLYCPVAEFGLVNKTIHQTDEHVSIKDLEALKNIYRLFIEKFFGQGA